MITTEEAFKLLEIVQSSETQKEAFDKLNSQLKEEDIISYLKDLNCIYTEQPFSWRFSCYLFYLLNEIIKSAEINSLDVNQANLFSEAVHKCEINALEVCVKRHKSRTTYDTTNQSDSEYEKLISCLRMFHKFFSVKLIATNPLFHDAQIDYLVGVLSVLTMKKSDQDINDANNMLIQLQTFIGTEQFFQFVMMVRGFQGLSKDFQIQSQLRLLQLIRSDNGFYMLCKMILRKKTDDSQAWQKYSVIAGILMKAMRNKSFYEKMVNEIFRTLRKCINSNENEIVAACVYVLKELYGKKEVELDEHLDKWILGPLIDLINPQILLCGSILMEYDEIKGYVGMLHVLFSSSTIVALPSRILHNHIVALFNLHTVLPDIPEKEKLASIVLFVLNNYDRKELQLVVRNLRLKDDPKVLKMHPRIVYKNNSLQIGEETTALIDDTQAFVLLLKNSNNSLLIYEIFISFIKLLSDVQNAGNSIITGYDLEEDELTDVLHTKFYKQLSIIEPLQDMIQWKSLHAQLNEKPKEILDAIKDVLVHANSEDEQIVIIFFSIYKELLYKLKDDEERQRMRNEILKVKEKFKKAQLKEQIDIIFNNNEEVPSIDPSEFTFNDAMKLLKSKEVYCKVYGCDNLIKMLRKRDKQALANRHTILAVAMQNMKEVESYAYLNVIKLLVALSYVLDTEVVDALIAEYQNKELEIDERLKFGEVVLKVTEDLGEMSMKFKQQLINCFLNGSRDSNNEFRTSSLANLGTICKILSYQVHNFFNELYQQLEVIIKSDPYLPSKRAASMVLSQILAGMPNLMEFQDYLLPIYHLLKDILANEEDQQTKLHAQIGLEHLNEKTKDFLNPKLNTQKEIKIRIGDDNPNKLNEIKFK
ncbi:transport and Golgi organization protein 6 [Chironomus tepperi]|uniref:transport and Golgi organization protein 6 n=1 Tax=Chironomus tepperi TaxID=113505 RepID=UPI00391F6C21